MLMLLPDRHRLPVLLTEAILLFLCRGMAHSKELETCLARAVAVSLVLGEQGIIKQALEACQD